jgi:membrane-associated phospholipid phosphatase
MSPTSIFSPLSMPAESIFELSGLVLATAMQRGVGRARPFLRDCKTPNADPDCAGSANSRNTSFISGHASLAFTAAATLCVQHSRLSLYGSANAVVCPAARGIAAGSSLLCVVADRHWTTDIIAGALVGSAVGAVVSAVHLRAGGSPDEAGITLVGEGQSMIDWERF